LRTGVNFGTIGIFLSGLLGKEEGRATKPIAYPTGTGDTLK
jgi:hypothetical protein